MPENNCVCECCSFAFYTKPNVIDKGGGRWCSNTCRYDPSQKTPLRERFQRYVGPPNENGCRLWTGHHDPAGYGRLNVDRRPVLAHRVAWELTHDDPGDLLVCHRCDMPSCVEISHLFLGTDADNVRDALEKKRMLLGTKNGHSKLTPDQVREIRRCATDGETQRSLATRFDVNQAVISRIVNRKLWRHIQ